MPLRRRIADAVAPVRFSGHTAALALVLVVLGILIGLGTFVILIGLTPIRPSGLIVRLPFLPEITVVQLLLGINSFVVVLMALLVAVQLFQLLRDKAKGTPGAGLHLRLVSLFSIVAVAPALLVAAFAAVTLNRGLDAWFSDRTRNIVDTASTVAEAYLINAGEATRK
jgi:two-component system nitrogen regulation sensor histidine kinase NtrY